VHLWLRHRERVDSSDAFRRAVLCGYAAVPPGHWRFSVGEHGKPDLVDPPRPLAFNLSHSGDWFACAVTAGTPVGVDLEHTGRKNDTARLARRYFTAVELEDIESQPGDARRERFFDYWTLKEAAVKARGDALPPSLRTRVFALRAARGDAPQAVSATDTGGVDPCAYYLFDPLPGYRLALCWPPGAAAPPRLRLFLEADGAAPAVSLRASPAGAAPPDWAVVPCSC